MSVLVVAKAACFELFRLHRACWRWFGLHDAAALTVANTAGSVLGAVALGSRAASIALAALLVIEWLVSQAFLLGSRLLYRILSEAGEKPVTRPRRRALIYGAGRRGIGLLRRMRSNPATPYEVVGFLDDDPGKRYLLMQMTPVLGSGDELPWLARLHQVEEVLIAWGPRTRANRERIQELAGFGGVRCRFPRGPRKNDLP